MALQTSDLPMLPPGQDPFSPQEVYTRSLLDLQQKRQKEDQQIAQNHQLLTTTQQYANDQSGMLSPSTQGQWKQIHGELALAAYDNPTKAPDKDTLAKIEQLHHFTQGELLAKQQSVPSALQPPPNQVAPGPQAGPMAGMLPQGAQQQTGAAQAAQTPLPPPPGAGAQPKPPGVKSALKSLIPVAGTMLASSDIAKYHQAQKLQGTMLDTRVSAANQLDQIAKDEGQPADIRSKAAGLAVKVRSDQPENYTQPFSAAVGSELQQFLQQVQGQSGGTPLPPGVDPNSLEGQAASANPRIRAGAESEQRGAGLSLAKAQTQRTIADQMMNAIKNTDWYPKLTGRQQGQIEASIRFGKDIPLSAEMRPQILSRDTSGEQILAEHPGATDIFGAPVKPGHYTVRGLGDGSTEFVPVQPKTKEVFFSDPESPSKFSSVMIDTTTNQPVSDKRTNALPGAGYFPREFVSQGMRFVQQPDNTWAAIPVQTVSQSSRQIPGASPSVPPPPSQPPAAATPSATPAGATPPAQSAPAPSAPRAFAGPPGQIVGGKGLTEQEKMNWQGKLGALDNTLDLAKKVQSRLPLLNSLLTAGKITLQTDPQQGIVHGILNRAMPMTDDEKQLASDVTSLIEHINVIRQPLGATGFRGAEAWGGLQAQRGSLMQNPDIAKGVLANTIKALQTQRQVISRGLTGKGAMPQGYDDQQSRGTPKTAEEYLQSIGHQ